MMWPHLNRRLRQLEDKDAILERMYSYGHALDYGDRPGWLDCWTENAELMWPSFEGLYSGRDRLGQAFDAHTHAPDYWHKHVVVDPRITIDGDRAHVESYFVRLDQGMPGPVVQSIGRYRDLLVRCDDGVWRFQQRSAEVESRLPAGPPHKRENP